jgi:hypothetical protein
MVDRAQALPSSGAQVTARGTKDGYQKRRAAIGPSRQLTIAEALRGDDGFVYVSFAMPANIYRRIAKLAETCSFNVNGWLRQTCFAHAYMGEISPGLMSEEAREQLELAMDLSADAERTRNADARERMAAGAAKPHNRPGRPRKVQP